MQKSQVNIKEWYLSVRVVILVGFFYLIPDSQTLFAASGTENPKARKSFQNGQYYMKRGRVAMALREWTNALKTDPQYGDAAYDLGGACFLMGKLELAEKYWLMAARLDNKNHKVWDSLGFLHTQKRVTLIKLWNM